MIVAAGDGSNSFSQTFICTVLPYVTVQPLDDQSNQEDASVSLQGQATDDGGLARVRGEFAGFTDPTATDLSILGRDVLDHFDSIISRQRGTIWLLAPRHQYRIDRG